MNSDPLGSTGQILECNNFLSDLECANLTKIMSACDNWVPDTQTSDTHYNYILSFSDGLAGEVFSQLNSVFTRAHEIVSTFYGDDFLISRPGVRQWHTGEELGAHYDAANADGRYFFHSPEGFRGGFRGEVDYIPRPAVDVSVLVYFNSDFEGGVLNFPRLGKSIQPSAGLLVAFPSTRYYFHEVTRLVSGFRYTAFSFFSRVNSMACLLEEGCVPNNWEQHFINPDLLGELVIHQDQD